jgi:hypothetical protein
MKCLLCILVALPLSAQTQPPRQLLPQVRDFLQLTNSQVLGIALNNDEYNRNIQDRLQRVRQVQTEIAVETAKDPVDPAQLGVRYTEIELICRELRDLANNLQKQNLALLTDEQRTRLKALDDVYKLLPVLIEAQMSNLLGIWTTAPNAMNGSNTFISGASLPVSPLNGCSGTGILALR